MTLHFDATESDLALFLDEAAEQLETLSSGLLELERDAGDPALIQSIFRAAHTLKGSSATIAHTRMASLTHAMESVLDGIRKGTLAVSPGVVDALLACVDSLHMLNGEVQTGVESPIDVEMAVAELKRATADAATAPIATAAAAVLSADEQAAIQAATTGAGAHALAIEVTIEPGSEWPAVRSYQALMELAPLGEIIRSWPSEEELQTGEGGHSLRVVIVTERERETLLKAVRSITEVAAVTATPHGEGVAPAEERGQVAPAGSPVPVEDQRKADLGPEMRGTTREEQTQAASQKAAPAQRMVKVDIARLDELMNLVGELVIDRGRLMQVLRRLSERAGGDGIVEDLSEITQHLSRVSDDLQEQVMLSRLLPVESVFNRFPRMVRDLARRTGKAVRFELEGEQTGLDRSVIDEIGDPILHLLRNAVDHGVEGPEDRRAAGKPDEATLLLSARHEENNIVIEVTDDGRGIDAAKVRESAVRKGVVSAEAAARLSEEESINLIFAPGFSTAEQVTDVSGRGVGMDIVRTNIEKIGGAVKVHTTIGEGTTFSIRLPLTLAIIRALLVRVGEAIFTVPLASVQETMRVQSDAYHTVHGRRMALLRGQTLPLVRLGDVFARPGQPVEYDEGVWSYIVVVRSGRTDLGLIVDTLIGEEEVVIKSLGGMLADTDGIAGATILGDGRVSMIVDVAKVVEKLAPRVATGR